MKYAELLASYLPSTVVSELLLDLEEKQDGVDGEDRLPKRHEYDAVALFADFSGFTALSEQMVWQHGPHTSNERLAAKLNAQFSQLVRVISSTGGDVIKFAGDAMIVLWPPGNADEKLENRTRRATQCAVQIQETMDRNVEGSKESSKSGGKKGKKDKKDDFDPLDPVELTVKIGLGVGQVSLLSVGGEVNRREVVAVGEPLVQALRAESYALPGDVILSPNAYLLVDDYFQANRVKECGSGTPFYRLDLTKAFDLVKKRRVPKNSLDDPQAEALIRSMIPAGALQWLDAQHSEFENYSSELRRVSVMFISLGLDDDFVRAAKSDAEMGLIHDALVVCQKMIYRFQGSLNKFLMDDKGATVIAVFGLPPFSHEDDSLRAVLCAMQLVGKLRRTLELGCSIGLTTGSAFCGVLGSQTRKEYSVLGDTVNLAARLMQAAIHKRRVDPKTGQEKKSKGALNDGEIYCDVGTRNAVPENIVRFSDIGKLHFKGKSNAESVFRPTTDNTVSVVCQSRSSAAQKFKTRYNKVQFISTRRVTELKESKMHQAKDTLGLYFSFGGRPGNDSKKRKPKKTTLTKRFSKAVGKTFSNSNRNNGGGGGGGGDALPPSSSGGGAFSFDILDELDRAHLENSKMDDDDGNDQECESEGERAKAQQVNKNIKSSVESQLAHAESVLSVPAPGNARRNSVFLSGGGDSLRDENLMWQVAVGGQDLLDLGVADRKNAAVASDLLDHALNTARSKNVVERGVVASQVAMVIQGTEMALPALLFNSNGEFLKAGNKQVGGSRPTPLKYAEAVATLGLNGGEIRIEADRAKSAGLRWLTGRSDGHSRSKSQGSRTPRGGGSGKESKAVSRYQDATGNGGTTLKLVMVPAADLDSIQSSYSRLLQSLVQRKIELVEFGKGSVSVVSGNPGAGKTHLVRTWCTFLMGHATVLSSSNKSWRFAMGKVRCGAWLEVVSAWLDEQTGREDETARQRLIARMLPDALCPAVQLLNEGLHVNFPADRTISGYSTQRAEETLVLLLTELVAAIAREERRLVVVFDDAERFDVLSWQVATILANQVALDKAPLMLVLAARPFEGHVDSSLGLSPSPLSGQAFGPELAAYRVFCQLSIVQFMRLGRMSEHAAKKLFRKDVGVRVVDIQDGLWELCESRCNRNPLLIREFAVQLRNARCPKLVKYTLVGGGDGKAGTAKKKEKLLRDPSSEFIASLPVRVQNMDWPAWEVHRENKVSKSKRLAYWVEVIGQKKKERWAEKLKEMNERVDVDTDESLKMYAKHYNLKLDKGLFAPAEVPPPITALSLLGARIDRLSPMEHMVLKIASVIGQHFPLRLVESVYQYSSEESKTSTNIEIRAACESLVDQHGLLRRGAIPIYNDEYVYEFTDEHIIATVRDRLLTKQKINLQSQITRARKSFLAQEEYKSGRNDRSSSTKLKRIGSSNRLSYNENAGPGAAAHGGQHKSLKQGILRLRQSKGGRFTAASSWKEHFVVLKDDAMFVFKSKDKGKGKKADEAGAHLLIMLSDANVWALPPLGSGEAGERPKTCKHGFVVLSNEWYQKGDLSLDPKEFLFACDDEELATKWQNKARMAINRLKLGTLMPSGGRHSGTGRPRTLSYGSSSRLLPFRARTHVRAEFARDSDGFSRSGDTVLFVTLKDLKQDVLSSTSGSLPRVYASVRANLPAPANLPHRVRKQTMPAQKQGGGVSAGVRFDETLAMALPGGAFLEAGGVVLEFVLWVPPESGQAGAGVGFDRVLGCASLPLKGLDAALQKKKDKGLDETISLSLPYSGAKRRAEAQLSVHLELLLSRDDVELLKKARNKVMNKARAINKKKKKQQQQESSYVEDEEEEASHNALVKDLVQLNKALVLNIARKSTQDELARQESTPSISLQDASTEGAFEAELDSKRSSGGSSGTTESPRAAAAGEQPPLSPALNKVASRGLTHARSESAIPVRDRWTSQSKRLSDSLTISADAHNNSAGSTDSALAHVDLLIGTLEGKSGATARRRKELEDLKQVLLARSFNTLVNEINLDEESRMWLAEFTRRPGASSSVSSPTNRTKKLEQARARAATLEVSADDYLTYAGRQLSYKGPDGVIGPHSLPYFLSRLRRDAIARDLKVFVHPVDDGAEGGGDMVLSKKKKTVKTAHKKRFSKRDMITLGEHLDKLEMLATDASAAANVFKQKTVRRSALVKALDTVKGGSPSSRGRTAGGNQEPCHVFQTNLSLSMQGLESAWGKWMIREQKQIAAGEKNTSKASLDYSHWDFDLALVPEELKGHLCVCLLRLFGLDGRFKISESVFRGFVEGVYAGMSKHDNPYHSFDHAVDVTQGMFVLLHRMQGFVYFDETEMLALYIAAMCHDLEHPGTNNRFQAATNSHFALKYERAPLESHHVFATFQLLRNSKANLLANLSKEEEDTVRNIIVETVLATDMTQHLAVVEELRGVIVRNPDACGHVQLSTIQEGERQSLNSQSTRSSDASGKEVGRDLITSEDRLTIAKALLHSADISNPSRAWHVSKRWQEAVLQEFFLQGDKEKELKIEVSPGMDRDTTVMEDMAVSFTDFIVAPLYVCLVGLMPKVSQICVSLAENRAQWAQLQENNVKKLKKGKERDDALNQIKKRSQAFEEILTAAGFWRSPKGGIVFAPTVAPERRRSSLYELETYAASTNN